MTRIKYKWRQQDSWRYSTPRNDMGCDSENIQQCIALLEYIQTCPPLIVSLPGKSGPRGIFIVWCEKKVRYLLDKHIKKYLLCARIARIGLEMRFSHFSPPAQPDNRPAEV